jgi:hypothetical protein
VLIASNGESWFGQAGRGMARQGMGYNVADCPFSERVFRCLEASNPCGAGTGKAGHGEVWRGEGDNPHKLRQ